VVASRCEAYATLIDDTFDDLLDEVDLSEEWKLIKEELGVRVSRKTLDNSPVRDSTFGSVYVFVSLLRAACVPSVREGMLSLGVRAPSRRRRCC
jgi:hypothetical protein